MSGDTRPRETALAAYLTERQGQRVINGRVATFLSIEELRQLVAALAASPAPGTTDQTPELVTIRQILAADMTHQPDTDPLPAPNRALELTALGVYHLVQEVRTLRAAPGTGTPTLAERCFTYECGNGDCQLHDTPTDWVECVGGRCPVSGQIVESRPEPPALAAPAAG